MLGLNYLTAECWASPTITMLQDSAKGKNQGFTINAYLLFATLAGSLSTWAIDFANMKLNPGSDPDQFGTILAYSLLISYLGSVPFFFMAGQGYEKLIKNRRSQS